MGITEKNDQAGYTPVLGAAGGTLAIMLAAPKLGIREDYLAWGAAAAGIITAMNTSGLTRQAATGVACAGVCIGLTRLLQAKAAKEAASAAKEAASNQPLRRQADGEYVTREHLKEALERFVEDQTRRHAAARDELLLSLREEIGKLRDAYASPPRPPEWSDPLARPAFRRGQPPGGLRRPAPVHVDPRQNAESAPLSTVSEAHVVELRQAAPVGESSRTDEETPAVARDCSPTAETGGVVPAELAHHPPARVARVNAIRDRLSAEEWSRLQSMAAMVTREQIDSLEEYLAGLPSVDAAAEYVRSTILGQRPAA